MDRSRLALFVAVGLGALSARPAAAASLQQVTSWGASGVPTYIAMYIYVPDKLATNPPILVVNHYCGGDASGVFNEAKGGGIVAASDMYGFIMVFPQNHLPNTTRNCWDVGSKASLTHDGGGDTQAIAQMVKYTLTKYNANANRVYSTGTSSGAMMTEALMAVYPDVFKGGAEFSGVPAGCWANQYDSSNQWSGPCAGGMDTMTAQAWGDLVRGMYSGYTGHRPRVQLWHGDADPTINYANQTEAIKEWTNVLGLATNPTATTTVSLSGHSWTHQSWQNSCGYTVLDAWTEKSGPHGTDANLNAQYVIPFLALDQAGDVDPEIVKCGGGGVGGASGTGGSVGTGGGGGRGGSAGAAGGRGGSAGAAGQRRWGRCGHRDRQRRRARHGRPRHGRVGGLWRRARNGWGGRNGRRTRHRRRDGDRRHDRNRRQLGPGIGRHDRHRHGRLDGDRLRRLQLRAGHPRVQPPDAGSGGPGRAADRATSAATALAPRSDDRITSPARPIRAPHNRGRAAAAAEKSAGIKTGPRQMRLQRRDRPQPDCGRSHRRALHPGPANLRAILNPRMFHGRARPMGAAAIQRSSVGCDES